MTRRCLADDDDDLDEDDIPGFSHPTIAQSPLSAKKGKTRAHEPEQLAPPSSENGRASPSLSGNIGSGPAGGSRSARQTVGGVQVETRFVDDFCEGFHVKLNRSAMQILGSRYSRRTGDKNHSKLLCVDYRFSNRPFLDEARDLLSIYSKLVQVLYPRRSTGREVLR